MRSKFVGTLFLLSALIVSAALWLKKRPESTLAAVASNETASQAVSLNSNSTPVKRTTPTVSNRLSPEQEGVSVEAEIERLNELSIQHDPASLSDILGALKSSDKRVREAAIEATMQTGDFNAIPALKEAAEMVNDLEGKIAFLGGIEFLSDPPLTFDGNSISPTSEQIAAADSRRALRRAERQRENGEPHSRRSSRMDSLPATTAPP